MYASLSHLTHHVQPALDEWDRLIDEMPEDEDGDPVAELRERGQTFTLVRDGDAIAALYGVKGTPGLFLVSRDGEIVYKRISGDAPEKVETALREKLALPAATTP